MHKSKKFLDYRSLTYLRIRGFKRLDKAGEKQGGLKEGKKKQEFICGASPWPGAYPA